MKQILMLLWIVMSIALISGCESLNLLNTNTEQKVNPLKSTDANVRKKAVETLTDQKQLFFIAADMDVVLVEKGEQKEKSILELLLQPPQQEESGPRQGIIKGEFPEDVRILAVNKLTDPMYLACCATWKDGWMYEDKVSNRRGNDRTFKWKGKEYTITISDSHRDDESRNFRQYVNLGDAVRSVAKKRLEELENIKKLASSLNVCEASLFRGSESVYEGLWPNASKDGAFEFSPSGKNKHPYFDVYEKIQPGNPLDVLMMQIINNKGNQEALSYVYNGMKKGRMITPLAYDAALMKLDPINSKIATVLFKKMILQNDTDLEKSLYYARKNIPNAYVELLFKNIKNPDYEIIFAMVKHCEGAITERPTAKKFDSSEKKPRARGNETAIEDLHNRDDRLYSKERRDISDVMNVFKNISSPHVISAILCSNNFQKVLYSLKHEQRLHTTGVSGYWFDFKSEDAKAILSNCSDDCTLGNIATNGMIHSVRLAAIEKIRDNKLLYALALHEYPHCPNDVEIKGYDEFAAALNTGDDVFSWSMKADEKSISKLRNAAIMAMTDQVLLRELRNKIKDVKLKKIITQRIVSAGGNDLEEIINARSYDSDIFEMLDGVSNTSDLLKISENANLKGIRLMAAGKISKEALIGKAKKELDKDLHKKEDKLFIHGFYLGQGIEETFARIAVFTPEIKLKLYFDAKDEVLCLKKENGRDIAWANTTENYPVYWLTLPPETVKNIFKINGGTLNDWESQISDNLKILFGSDKLKKGEVSQDIGNLETMNGETLRFFRSELSFGEKLDRSVRKTLRGMAMEENPEQGGVGNLFANIAEDAAQAKENESAAKSHQFAEKGSLQLLMTKRAAKGVYKAEGSFR